MIKPVSVIISAALLTVAISAQADRKTGGDDAYYIDTRGPISNNVVVDWMDSKVRGGDAYNGAVKTSSNFKVYYVAPEPKGGDNK